MLRLENLGRRFGRNVAVNTVSLDIPEGQMVGIIGAAGAGKSTLLRLVSRLIDPTEGRILFGDVDIAQLKGRDLREWRSDCAMMAPQCSLMSQLSVMSNVMAGLLIGMPHWRSRARIFTPRERMLALHALDRVGMAHAAPQRAAILSPAGQKRVAIARALAQQPKILFADDPVAQLDHAQSMQVMGQLRAINRQDGLTIVCSLPNLHLAGATCDRIIGMRGGSIVYDGAPDAIGAAQLRHIYGAEADVFRSADVPLDMVNAA